MKTSTSAVALSAILGILGSCSGSLFSDPNMFPHQEGPNAAQQPQSQQQSANAAPALKITIRPDADLADQNPFAILLGTSASDPWTAGSLPNQLEAHLALQTLRIDYNEKLREVDARLSLKIDRGNGAAALTRVFRATPSLILKTQGNDDTMTGTLAAEDDSKTVISIEARRIHSATLAEAQKNPWSGRIGLVQDGDKKPGLADLSGLSE